MPGVRPEREGPAEPGEGRRRVTRDDLELILRREGLTRPQVTAVLQAADAYATAQARLAADAAAWRKDRT